MAKSVKLTIKGAGDAGANAPSVDDLLGQMRDFVEILQGVEKAFADDHANEIIWRVTDAERKNPITFELTPFATNLAIFVDTRAEQVERIALEGMAAIQRGNVRPQFFTDDTIAKARKINARVINGLIGTEFALDDALGIEPVVITPATAREVDRVFEADKAVGPVPYREFGSIEGFVTKAERDGHNHAVLRFRARISGVEIKAIATGDAFQQLEALRLSDVWHGIRVRVYGTINYRGLGIVESVSATGIEVLDRTDLPGIDDIIDPTFTAGLSSEAYLAELRRE